VLNIDGFGAVVVVLDSEAFAGTVVRRSGVGDRMFSGIDRTEGCE